MALPPCPMGGSPNIGIAKSRREGLRPNPPAPGRAQLWKRRHRIEGTRACLLLFQTVDVSVPVAKELRGQRNA
jgi:hypothetical protein